MVDHYLYRVEPTSDSTCLFIQSDQAKGGHGHVAGRMSAHATRGMHQGFNAELKEEAGARYRSSAEQT
jgi:hypothetical protein